MSKAECYVCDHTNEIFRHKDSYILHLKQMARGRLVARRTRKENERISDAHKDIYRCGSFEEIAAYICKHWKTIEFYRAKTKYRIRNIFFSDLYWYPSQRDFSSNGNKRIGAWTGFITFEASANIINDVIFLLKGLSALGIQCEEFPDRLGNDLYRFDVNIFVNRPWVNLAVAESLRTGENIKLFDPNLSV